MQVPISAQLVYRTLHGISHLGHRPKDKTSTNSLVPFLPDLRQISFRHAEVEDSCYHTLKYGPHGNEIEWKCDCATRTLTNRLRVQGGDVLHSWNVARIAKHEELALWCHLAIPCDTNSSMRFCLEALRRVAHNAGIRSNPYCWKKRYTI